MRNRVISFYVEHPRQTSLDAALLALSAIACVFWRDMAIFHFYVAAVMAVVGVSGLSIGLQITLARAAALSVFAVIHSFGHQGWALESFSEVVLFIAAAWTGATFGAYRRWSRRDEARKSSNPAENVKIGAKTCDEVSHGK